MKGAKKSVLTVVGQKLILSCRRGWCVESPVLIRQGLRKSTSARVLGSPDGLHVLCRDRSTDADVAEGFFVYLAAEPVRSGHLG